MAKYSFKGHDKVTFMLDFTDGFALLVTFGDIDGRKTKRKRFEFKTARGLANAENTLFEENPQCRYNGFWADNRPECCERRNAYNRAYESAHELLPF